MKSYQIVGILVLVAVLWWLLKNKVSASQALKWGQSNQSVYNGAPITIPNLEGLLGNNVNILPVQLRTFNLNGAGVSPADYGGGS